ncbi:MAG: glycoside hydrolase family 3 C-terminal domain-containing protein [Chitinispirillaceae bacterium]|nr:glycoside hydrolase family 3 C-terminal domain-containing protein [Chitinispirillaceae bacterium]
MAAIRAGAAAASDVALVVVGNNPLCNNPGWGVCWEKSEGKEQKDRDSITLEPLDENLIRDVYAANPNTVVLILSSFPYAANWAQANVPAILHMTHNSQELGNALADVLFGDYNPGGKTTQTWPSSLGDLPEMIDYNIRNGRTYMYFAGTPLYPFGYGLSYTTFRYANCATSSATLDAKAAITVSADVTNTGSVAGEEVVQMYVRHLNSAVPRPQKELRGFRRVALAAGETKTVTMELPGRYLAYWDSAAVTWTVECNKVEIQVGASSADIKLYDTVSVTNCGPIDISPVVKQPQREEPAVGGAAALSGIGIVKHGATTAIVVRMNRTADLKLCLYRLDGTLLFNATGRGVSSGNHIFPLDARLLAAGVYLVTAQTHKRMLVSKWGIGNHLR